MAALTLRASLPTSTGSGIVAVFLGYPGRAEPDLAALEAAIRPRRRLCLIVQQSDATPDYVERLSARLWDRGFHIEEIRPSRSSSLPWCILARRAASAPT